MKVSVKILLQSKSGKARGREVFLFFFFFSLPFRFSERQRSCLLPMESVGRSTSACDGAMRCDKWRYSGG